jgi:hypothetical protein
MPAEKKGPGISFQHGAQMSGIGRGSTFLKYHLTEVASHNNAEQLIEAALTELRKVSAKKGRK